MKKRIFCLLVAIALCVSLFPMSALAAENPPEDGAEDAGAAVLAEDGGSCDLTALVVAYGTSTTKNTELTLSPTFSSGGTEYTVDALKYVAGLGDRKCYVKATVANEGATIAAQLNNGTVKKLTSGNSSYVSVGAALEPGKNNDLTVTVTNGDETKTYTVTIPMRDSEGNLPVEKTLIKIEITTPPAKTTYNVGESFDNRGMVVTAYYSDDSTEIVTLGYTWTPREIAADTKAITVSYNGQTAEQEITVNVPVPSYNTTITVPSDATLFVGQKVKHFMPFTPVEPEETSTDSAAGTTTYSFNLTDGGTYNYRVSGDEYVTYAGTFTKYSSNDIELAVSDADLKPAGKTKTTVDHDVSSNGGYNVADIYLNINAKNYLKLANGATYQLVNLRTWETTNTVTDNYFIEPDYHYTVVDTSGNPSSGVVTVSDSGIVTAVGNGTAIVLVTYDAVSVNGALGGPFFGAIWPENTGVFVVSVGAGDSGINTGMTINEGKNNTANKLSGDALDSEHDVIYFTGDSGSYTFTPVTAGCSVAVANPTVDTKMSFSGFESVSANSDGSFTVPLTEGRNIVKISKGGDEEYQVITAKKVKISINNGDTVHPGDDITITFDSVYHPASKLAGVYNMAAVIEYTNVGGKKASVGSTSSQYQFASTTASQTVSGTLERTETSFSVTYEAEGAITVPADYSYDTFTLSGGAIIADGFGDPYGNHRSIEIDVGRDPNFDASIRTARLGQLPDIEIPIVISEAELEGITLDTTNVKTDYYEGDSFNTTNLVVTAKYSNGTTGTVTNYTVTPSVLTAGTEKVTVTYREQTAEIPVTVTPVEVVSIAITTPPSQTAYTAGSVFNPAGMVVTATYSSGATKVIGDYTFSPARELTTEDTSVTVTYGGCTATTPVTVTPASSGGDVSSNITVSFTLYGDEVHGTSAGAAGTHTLKKGNLDVWIAQTSVTVPQGSKIIDVVAKALGLAGIPFENPSGNYITSIRGLAEFSNGNLSGWMYTLNGKHPNLGVGEQFVENGDVVVFHYTDDYTVEQGTENWGPKPGNSGDTTASSATEAKVTVEKDANGETVAKVELPEGAAVAVATIPTAELGSGNVLVRVNSDGSETVIKKSLVENGTAYALLNSSCTVKLADNSKTFDDTASHWAKDAVAFAASHELFQGVSANTFAPDTSMSRAMLATVLYRLEDAKASGTNPFADVKADTWYTDAVTWANGGGIVSGTGKGFEPDRDITRQELVVMLYRYAKTVGMDTGMTTSISNYDDAKDVAAWADEAMGWAVANGLVNGRSATTLAPTGTATRAEVAAILQRLIALMVQ